LSAASFVGELAAGAALVLRDDGEGAAAGTDLSACGVGSLQAARPASAAATPISLKEKRFTGNS
jgi:hypothetical protein